MKRMSWLLLSALLVSVAATTVEAQEESPVAEDPAFDRYVDPALLGDALENLNAGLAADVALQLAEGERILGRSHAAITADGAFSLALKVALQVQDAKTIERLATVSAKNGRTEWATQLQAAKGLLGASRAVEPGIDTAGMSDEGLAFTEAVVQGLRLAQVAGDVAAVADYKAAIQETDMIDKARQASLLKFADGLGVTAAEGAGGETIEVEGLMANSRSSEYYAPPGALALSVSGGVICVPNTAGIAKADLQISNQMAVPLYAPADAGHPGTLAISNGKDFYVDAKTSKVVVTAWKTVEVKMPTIKVSGGFPAKPITTYRIVKHRVPAKVIEIPLGFGLTGGKRIKATLKK